MISILKYCIAFIYIHKIQFIIQNRSEEREFVATTKKQRKNNNKQLRGGSRDRKWEDRSNKMWNFPFAIVDGKANIVVLVAVVVVVVEFGRTIIWG